MSTCGLLIFVPKTTSEFGIDDYIKRVMEPFRIDRSRDQHDGRFDYLVTCPPWLSCEETESDLSNAVRQKFAGRITSSPNLRIDDWKGELLTPNGEWLSQQEFSHETLKSLCDEFPNCWIVCLLTHA